MEEQEAMIILATQTEPAVVALLWEVPAVARGAKVPQATEATEQDQEAAAEGVAGTPAEGQALQVHLQKD